MNDRSPGGPEVAANGPATTPSKQDPVPDSPESAPGGRRVPMQTVARLTLYRKILVDLQHDGVAHVFSHRLAELAGVHPAQLRRDLSLFGSFGSVTRGYDVFALSQTIGRLLGTDRLQVVALVGLGNLGRTLLTYRGFEERGFHFGVVFDRDPEKVGRVYAGRRCHHIDEMEKVLPDYGARLAVLACGPAGLENLVDRLARCGVRAILNFVPRHVTPPPGVHVEEVDLSGKLETLSFLARDPEPSE